MGNHLNFFEVMHLDAIFPNVQIIQLEHQYNCCKICNYDLNSLSNNENFMDSGWMSAVSFAINTCLRRSKMVFFTRFSKLTKLLVCYISESSKFSMPFDRTWISFTTENLHKDILAKQKMLVKI